MSNYITLSYDDAQAISDQHREEITGAIERASGRTFSLDDWDHISEVVAEKLDDLLVGVAIPT